MLVIGAKGTNVTRCLLYTSDAADERSSVDLGGRRIIKKKKHRRDHSDYVIKYESYISDVTQHADESTR